jgi:copper chaperone CopZ
MGLSTGLAVAETMTVTVTGMGEDQDAAVKDAKRKAVEQVAVKIYSQSEVQDFVLVKDTILTRSAGFVEDSKILSTSTAEDGLVSVKMEIVVSKNQIQDMWGVVKGLLKDMGRPKIMVYITEKIDGKAQPLSTLQTGIEQSLLASGFLLVDRAQVEAIAQKDIEAAIAEDNTDKLMALAKQFKAHLFITGVVTATSAGQRNLYGRQMWIYQSNGNVRTFRADTGQMLSAQTGATGVEARGVKDVAESAAAQALQGQADYLAPRITGDILQFWMDVLGGHGELKLVVENIDFGGYMKLKKAIEGIDGVEDANADFANNVATISVQAKLSAEKLAEKLYESMGESLEISDLSKNVIKGTWKK